MLTQQEVDIIGVGGEDVVPGPATQRSLDDGVEGTTDVNLGAGHCRSACCLPQKRQLHACW